MTATIIILAYVASVFLNRWLNKIEYKKEYSDIMVWTWFIPFAGVLSWVIIILKNIEIKKNWFTGKNW